MITKNISYGALDAHKLDYYEAEDSRNKPIFVFFHGGGLEGGDKGNGDVEAFRYLSERGISVVSADYRMYPTAHFPDFVLDAAECTAWCRKNLSYSEMYVGGQSAGGYLTMMLAFDRRYLGKYGIAADDKAEIAGYYCDAGQPTVHYNVLRERGLDTRLIRVDEAAPVYFIEEVKNPDSLPRYGITVSDNDMVCRLEQNMMLRRTMIHMGYPEEKITFRLMRGFTHCGYGGVIDEDGKPKYGKMIEEFILGSSGN
ncbi:MAG: alpha/beta hydrolase [Eubacteriales bacterium]